MSHQIFLLARTRSNATEGVVYDCDTLTAEAACTAQASCEWVYNGQGAQYQVSTFLREGSLTALIVTVYQVLVGPAYIYTFSSSALVLGLVLDRFNRPLIMGAGEDDLTVTASEDDLTVTAGVVVFSLSCVLMGFSQQFWQLVVLRMGIALGEAVCRPAASSLIADRFRSDNQGSFYRDCKIISRQ